MHGGTRTRVASLSIVIVMAIVSVTIPVVYMATSGNGEPGIDDRSQFDPFVETRCSCSCRVIDADLYAMDQSVSPPSISYLMDVTNVVKWRDGWFVAFNKNYLLRLVFNQNLTNGCTVIVYGRYSTVAPIKALVLSTTNFTEVGTGEMGATWGYYNLTLTGLSEPTDTLYFYIPDNPSNNKMWVDQIKCYCPPPVIEPRWRDPATGIEIASYTFNINYVITTSGNVNTSEVYLDISLYQTITNQLDNTTIIGRTMIERSSLKVPAVNVPGSHVSREFLMISRAMAGVDNITITLDVDVTVRARIHDSNDWVVLGKSFDTVRSFNAWWY